MERQFWRQRCSSPPPMLCLALVLLILLFVSPDHDRSSVAAASVIERTFDCLDPRVQSDGFRWNTTEQLWMYPTPQDAGGCLGLQEPFRTRQDLVNLLQGKHVIFLGDSTVRNLVQTTFGLLCNPTYFEACGQVNHYPFQDEKLASGMNCSRHNVEPDRIDEVEEKMRRRYGEVVPNTCNSEISFQEVELPNLTARKMYRTAKERFKSFWRKKKIPPLLNIKFRTFSASVIEAGCMAKRNSVERVLNYIREGGGGDLIPKFDLLVTSASFHCSWNDFHKKGKEPWYTTIPRALRKLRDELGVPVLWTETPYCSTEALMDTEEAKNNRAPCSEYVKHRPVVLKNLQPDGPLAPSAIPITPAYWITKDGEPVKDRKRPLTKRQERAPCAFADSNHPGLACYRAIATVMVKSIAMVLDIRKSSSSSAGSPRLLQARAKDTRPERGTRDQLGSSSSNSDQTETRQKERVLPPSPGKERALPPSPESMKESLKKISGKSILLKPEEQGQGLNFFNNDTNNDGGGSLLFKEWTWLESLRDTTLLFLLGAPLVAGGIYLRNWLRGE